MIKKSKINKNENLKSFKGFETVFNISITRILQILSIDQDAFRKLIDQKIPFDIYYEDKNFIVLIVSANLGGATIALNKNDLTYGGSQIFHPFDNYDIDDYTSGKCDKIN